MFKFIGYAATYVFVAMITCGITILWANTPPRSAWEGCAVVTHSVQDANAWVFEQGYKGWERVDENYCVY